MANTTFTGNVRENGDGSRTSIAGSMVATANFHIPNTLAAGDGNVQKSDTDVTQVILPKGAVVYQVGFWQVGAAANTTLDLGFTPVGTGLVVADPDAFLDNQQVVTKSLVAVGGGTAGAILGGISNIVAGVQYGPSIVGGAGNGFAREQVIVTHTASVAGIGAVSGILYYFIADPINGAESN
jgi:hypothetical protein|tara:strand:+ start:70 stop:615 length:546 start_codon:yes stop_codon:yes gene_type:complete